MYSTCLFCKSSLGANEAIEQFPIGRRLAFDAAKGRLWVVCRRCERWNLTPIEERWEAIEACERSYRATKLRTSTDQIGLARLGEGLELVRIGKPLRPEFAAWRYGDQFGARRRRNMLRMGVVTVAVAATPFIGPVLGLSFGTGSYSLFQFASFGRRLYDRTKVVARLTGPDETPLFVRYYDATQTVILPPTLEQPWGLRISHRNDRRSDAPWWRYRLEADHTDIRGDDAIRAAAQLLPQLNRTGASESVVRQAVTLAAANDDPAASFDAAARFAANRRSWNEYGKGAMLGAADPELRLALEMVSHEDSERRALEGELHLLEEAWRDAEEIASIADNLFLPSEISTHLDELKRKGR